MAWENSTRASRLPPDWQRRRRLVLERDGYRCTELTDGERCTEPATDVDHRTPGDDHSLPNLRALCRWHHARKSSSEGNASRRRFTARRPVEPHPGMR